MTLNEEANDNMTLSEATNEDTTNCAPLQNLEGCLKMNSSPSTALAKLKTYLRLKFAPNQRNSTTAY